MKKTACIILAAGNGKRMNSAYPKALAQVLFKPMLGWTLDAAETLSPDEIRIVAGNGENKIKDYLEKRGGDYVVVHQAERRGTGHAAMLAIEDMDDFEEIAVLCADTPFMDSVTLSEALKLHRSGGCGVTVISAVADNPYGYGRIIRDEHGNLSEIVEQKDALLEQQRVREINSGAYWFNGQALREALPKLSNENASGEFYLTDAVRIIKESGRIAAVYTAENKSVVMGANTRADLCSLNYVARMNVIGGFMAKGVNFLCTDGVIIGNEVEIGADTTIYPNTIIRGKCSIGCGCEIGPNTTLTNVNTGDGVVLNNVQAEETVVGSGSKIGPFVNLRSGTKIGNDVKIGDFVEIKNSEIGEKTSVAHLTYVGDSDVGRGVNFGCGCVTANYDGIKKFRTRIGDNAFIGCNTNLIAPVEIGENAATGAGSTITKNVPPNALAVERSETKTVPDWEKNKLRKKRF